MEYITKTRPLMSLFHNFTLTNSLEDLMTRKFSVFIF